MRWHLFLVAGVLLAGCEGIDTDKANKKVDEANKALNEGNDLIKTAAKHLTAATSGDTEAEAKKCMKAADEAAEKFDEASKLAKEASEMKVKKIFGEYLSLKSKSFAKRGEVAATAKKQCKGLADKGDIEQIMKIGKEIEKLGDEADELDEKAEKIQKDNPTDFK